MDIKLRKKDNHSPENNGIENNVKTSNRKKPKRTTLNVPFHLRKAIYTVVMFLVLGIVLTTTMKLLSFTEPPIEPSTSPMPTTTTTPHTQEITTTTFYSAIVDAGSTGSRMLVFRFMTIGDDMRLDGEFFREVKPGLSSYAKEPEKAADSLRGLIDDAKGFIPESDWSSTPLVLRATAGLRLLPGHRAQNILDEVVKLFEETPFLLKSVDIMDGTDEGTFAWFTVNFLLKIFEERAPKNAVCKLPLFCGNFNFYDRCVPVCDIDDTVAEAELHKSVAIMDLGGGSTQIAFVPLDQTTEDKAPDDHLTKVVVANRNTSLYVHSYLGLGLMAARYSILTKTHSTKLADNVTEFHSPCFHPHQYTNWSYAGKNFTITGQKEGSSSAERCYSVASSLVEDVHKPAELRFRPIYTMSYYYDRALESGLIRENVGGIIQIQDFKRAADIACSNPPSSTEDSFMCLDLTYITALLKEGLGLPLEKTLELRKRIGQHELSWALGAAFRTLNTISNSSNKAILGSPR